MTHRRFNMVNNTKKDGTLNINSNLRFGKYNGCSVRKISNVDPDYLIWCHVNYQRVTEEVFNLAIGHEVHKTMEKQITQSDDLMLIREDYDVCKVNNNPRDDAHIEFMMHPKSLTLDVGDTVIASHSNKESLYIKPKIRYVHGVNCTDEYLSSHSAKLPWVSQVLDLSGIESLIESDAKILEQVKKSEMKRINSEKRKELIERLGTKLVSKLRKLTGEKL